MTATAVAGAIALSGCASAADGADVVPSLATDTADAADAAEATRAAAPTTPSTPTPLTSAAASSDPASLAVDRLFEVFNAQDAEGVADFFGDDVGFTLESGEVVVGADAVAFWQGYFGKETGERLTDAFHAPDGLTYFLTEFARSSGGSATFVFDVDMDGERPARLGARLQNGYEVIATTKVDELHRSFNAQDLDRLAEEFEGITFTSADGVELAGGDAAEHWADAFGSTVTRTTGVFSLGEGAYGFATEHRSPDSDLSTPYSVEVELSAGQMRSMTERRQEP